MSTINIYKDKANTVWENDETFLCVFDNNNNLISYYDFCTGLKLMQDDKEMTIFINSDDLALGKWTFFGTKVVVKNKKELKEKVKVDGIKNEKPQNNAKIYSWPNENCGPGKFVSKKEREERISICKQCPLFDLQNITCTINEKIILKTTKYEHEYCPKEKWGDKDRIMANHAASAKAQGIFVPNPVQIDAQEQADFEAELEGYLKGL
jgi:hypothetical protein